MAQSQIVNSSGESYSDNTTTFVHLAGKLLENATEARQQTIVRDAGTFSNLYVRATANTTTTASSVITFRKSVADTALAVTYAAAETGAKEDTDSVTVAATDECNYQVAVASNAGTTAITLSIIGITFTPTNSANTITFLSASTSNNWNNASETEFQFINGGSAVITAANETTAQVTMRGSYTLSDFYVFAESNARTNDTVFRIRKNTADGNSSITFAAAETGAKEDTSSTESIVSGDIVNYSVTTGTGTELLATSTISCTCISTANEFPLIGTVDAALAQNFNVTNFKAISGLIGNSTQAEADVQIEPNFTFSVKNLNAYVSANTIATSASTITLRDDGANGNGSLSYAAAETGHKVDTDSDTITADTDFLNYTIVTPNTSGVLTVRNISCTGVGTAGAATRRRFVA